MGCVKYLVLSGLLLLSYLGLYGLMRGRSPWDVFSMLTARKHAACSEKLRGNELWFILLRAGLLFGLLFWLGKL